MPTPFTMSDYSKCKCPHQGVLNGSASGDAFTLGGVPTVTVTDLASATIAGCQHYIGPTHVPCVNLTNFNIPLEGADLNGIPVADADKVSELMTNNGVPVSLEGDPFGKQYM